MSALLILLGTALAQDCEGATDCLAQGLDQALVQEDDSLGEALLARACGAGDELSCFHLAATRLRLGQRVEVPASEPGLAELKRRCEADQGRACLQLGLLHDKGPMGWRDMSQASMYFRQACAAGQPEGCVQACDLGHAASCAPAPLPPSAPQPADPGP